MSWQDVTMAAIAAVYFIAMCGGMFCMCDPDGICERAYYGPPPPPRAVHRPTFAPSGMRRIYVYPLTDEGLTEYRR